MPNQGSSRNVIIPAFGGTGGVDDGRVARLYRWKLTRYVIDSPSLLHVVAEDIKVAPAHQLVAPTLIRSQALALLLSAVQRGDITDEVALQRHEGYAEIKIRFR